tara:strand:- start:4084 stop:4563 length:480 start_codon:yes stop_codon:yes gene_type:complete
MVYNFNKNLKKNENNSYSLSISLPDTYELINYKIYSDSFILQSGSFQNSSIKKLINIDIDNLDTIFILMNVDHQEFFELINLKNLYNKTLENIKIELVKNKISTIENRIGLNLSNMEEDVEDEDEEEEEDDDEEEEDDDDDNKSNEDNLENISNQITSV